MVDNMDDNHLVVLIESIRDFPQIWDPLNPEHGRKDISQQNWDTVCNRCATYGVILQVEEAKRIWRSLRDTYKRIRSKAAPSDKIRWRFFSDMSFLPANLMESLNGTTNPAPKRAAPLELLEPFRGIPLEMPSTMQPQAVVPGPIPIKRRLLEKKHEIEEIKIRKELLAIEKAQLELTMRKRHLELELQELHCKHETEILTEAMEGDEESPEYEEEQPTIYNKLIKEENDAEQTNAVERNIKAEDLFQNDDDED